MIASSQSARVQLAPGEANRGGSNSVPSRRCASSGSVEMVSLNPWNPTGTHPQQTGLITGEMAFLPFAGAGTLGIRRPLFEAIGEFDPTLACYEEADLCWRLQSAGHGPPWFVEDATLHYRLERSPGRRWRKAIQFGQTQALLYSRYRRAGMPRGTAREAVAAWAPAKRVGILGSGGLSHFVVDEALDRHVLDILARRDVDAIGALPLDKLDSGNSEIRNWIVVAAAAVDLDLTWISYTPAYRTPALTGTGLAFARWS